MTLRRAAALSVSAGVVATYVHSAVSEGLGKIGVLVALESSGDADKLNGLGRQIAMHIAATSPLALNVDELDPAVVERERSVFTEQARESGKPDNIIEKMVEGRIRKFYEEVTLVKQAFVIDPDKTVEQAVEALAKELGTPVKLVGFVNCTGDFADQPKVVNGASDFLVDALGERGRHARSAVGVASLPFGAAVEVEAILEIA